ncbi:histidine kinase [Catenovulum sp. 2E275]|uniref:sensor histidine kinase n=1 Tax=Catenovulum sp. 2E275 TaxID=2980497 RepID=UPI0021D11E17|nr:histidine kinase [Catenovulum sp. 2E275]MCU4677540.1 histidine kinase [Catenovulum sp. 2E275]
MIDSSDMSEQAHEQNILQLESQAFISQRRQFWTLQISGWMAYALIVFFAIVHPQFEDPDFNLAGQLLNLLVETLSGFTLSYLQWLLIRRIVHLPLKQTLFLSFFSAAVLGLIYNVIKLSCYKVIVYQQHWNQAWNMLEFGGWLLFSLTTMFVWTAIFFIMLYNTKLQKEHEMLLRAQTSAKDAQLQMLRYQLNPHFMFNTMNAISTLIYKNENDKANDMLDKLCEFLRYTLDKNTKPQTTLNKELELLELYLSCEKIRFGERLQLVMQIEPQVLSCKLPSMLLQPLVENSIKYAIEPRKEAGCIEITAKAQGERLLLMVADNGYGQSEKVNQGFGIGMSNTKARLDAMFNGDFEIQMTENDNKGTSVLINIPLEK